MDVWDDLIGDLWPDDAGDEGVGARYIRNRLNENTLRKALGLRLGADLGAESVGTLQLDWAWHYRFTYSLLAAFAFNPHDPAQWFVDAGLNKYPQKARDVRDNIAVVEQRLAIIVSLLGNRSETPVLDMDSLIREWMKIQAYPAWVTARWVLQIAAGLRAGGDQIHGAELLKHLPEESLSLVHRYASALEHLLAAAEQAVNEAIDRPA